MSGEGPDSKVIKASLAYRAKYKSKRHRPKMVLQSWQIVPHPKNRCGEPIRTLKTKTLAGDILYNGYDPTEATVDSVVVEVGLDASKKPLNDFRQHFHASQKFDTDHYYDPDFVIEFAGVSHNSKNLCERNIKHGMPGCSCDPVAATLDKCSCHAKPILEEKGGLLVYSMAKLRDADHDWHIAIVGGCEWEILSSDMDTEEPEAAPTIALALNTKNKIAQATGHLEMMRTMKGLIKPDPHTLDMPWATVKASMVKAFGNAVLHDSFKDAFQLMLTSGGSESTTWADFFEWAGHYVDESKRMIRPEAYKVLAEYPLNKRNVVKMHLKTMWMEKSNKSRILVDPPTSLIHRLQGEGSTFGWPA